MTTAAVIVFGSMLAFIVWYPLRMIVGDVFRRRMKSFM